MKEYAGFTLTNPAGINRVTQSHTSIKAVQDELRRYVLENDVNAPSVNKVGRYIRANYEILVVAK